MPVYPPQELQNRFQRNPPSQLDVATAFGLQPVPMAAAEVEFYPQVVKMLERIKGAQKLIGTLGPGERLGDWGTLGWDEMYRTLKGYQNTIDKEIAERSILKNFAPGGELAGSMPPEWSDKALGRWLHGGGQPEISMTDPPAAYQQALKGSMGYPQATEEQLRELPEYPSRTKWWGSSELPQGPGSPPVGWRYPSGQPTGQVTEYSPETLMGILQEADEALERLWGGGGGAAAAAAPLMMGNQQQGQGLLGGPNAQFRAAPGAPSAQQQQPEHPLLAALRSYLGGQ